MKFLTFSDVHRDKKAIKKLLERAKKDDIDFMVCAGDLSIFGRGLRESLDQFNSIGKKMYFIPGNHENHLQKLPELIAQFSNCELFHEQAIFIGDYLFLGYGGDGFSQKDAHFRKLARTWYGQYRGKKIILVTHGPPYGTAVDLIQEQHVGNYDFRQCIERIKPKVVICGHLHETAGQIDMVGKTKIINPGWDGLVIELP